MKKKLTEKEYYIYELGFEDGYATAKRVYRPVTSGRYTNESGESITKRTRTH